MLRIGLISDTHGLLRPEALDFLQGCDHIVHGGDIGGPEILARLAEIAPVTAVRGNNDQQPWAAHIADSEFVQIGGVYIYAVHDIDDVDLDPAAAGIQLVVTGHSHRPLIEMRDGVWFVNPGSAGPRRFKLPISCGELIVDGDRLTPRIVEFDIPR